MTKRKSPLSFIMIISTPVGFEPTQGDPIGLAGRRLSHSAKVSSNAFLKVVCIILAFVFFYFVLVCVTLLELDMKI